MGSHEVAELKIMAQLGYAKAKAQGTERKLEGERVWLLWVVLDEQNHACLCVNAPHWSTAQ